jgi:hypothetical protein
LKSSEERNPIREENSDQISEKVENAISPKKMSIA